MEPEYYDYKIKIGKTTVRFYTKEELEKIQAPEIILKVDTLAKNRSWMPEVADINKRKDIAAIQIIAHAGKKIKKRLIQKYLQTGLDPVVYGEKVLEKYKHLLEKYKHLLD